MEKYSSYIPGVFKLFDSQNDYSHSKRRPFLKYKRQLYMFVYKDPISTGKNKNIYLSVFKILSGKYSVSIMILCSLFLQISFVRCRETMNKIIKNNKIKHCN